ncbi:polymer-forming cytoskeletal protein [Nocardia xishanensis]|uniref:Polymer-forming cytoskeletal protein n=1 Tax=Nocardia xishanensis TaxID=238964 RepID=A0ABW7WV95_9NOCA
MADESIESLSETGRAEQATEADLEKILDEDIRDCLDDDTKVHRGDLRIDGDLDIDNGALIVIGNLSATGSIATDETGSLIVTGSVECRHLYLEGNLEIQGNATMRGVVYGFYEAGISGVYGTTKAKVGLIGNHCWECQDEEYEVGGTFSNFHAGSFTGDPEALRRVVGERAFQGLGLLLGLSQEEPNERNSAWGLSLFRDM